MTRKSIWQLVLLLALATPSLAQDSRIEINPFLGYTFSEGFQVNPNTVVGLLVDKVNPTSGFSWGVQVGVFATENAEVGFLFSEQDSDLQLESTGIRRENVAELTVRNYHGVFTYNWGDERSQARPFLFGGLGATNYSFGQVSGFDIDSNTRFSTTWGGGVKVYPGGAVGFSAMARWTPTYIKSDPAGLWCSPYWPGGCWVVADADYSNQLELTAGVLFRF